MKRFVVVMVMVMGAAPARAQGYDHLHGLAKDDQNTVLYFADGGLRSTRTTTTLKAFDVTNFDGRLAPYASRMMFPAPSTSFPGCMELFWTDGYMAYSPNTRCPQRSVSMLTETAATSDGRLYYAARDSDAGLELWVRASLQDMFDHRVIDLAPGLADGVTGAMAAWGTRVVFAGSTATTGVEPWITDGTEAGTVMLADTVAGTGASAIEGFTIAGSFAYFFSTSATGTTLWRSDGTPQGTVAFAPAAPGQRTLGVSDSSVVFAGLDAQQQPCLVFAGMTPTLIANVEPTGEYAVGGTNVYLTAIAGGQRKLYAYDGHMLREITDVGTTPRSLQRSSDRLYVIADDDLGGQLYRIVPGAASQRLTHQSHGYTSGVRVDIASTTDGRVYYAAPGLSPTRLYLFTDPTPPDGGGGGGGGGGGTGGGGGGGGGGSFSGYCNGGGDGSLLVLLAFGLLRKRRASSSGRSSTG